MAIENQPAPGGDGLVERAFDSIAVEMLFDQGRRPQVLQIHHAAVDAGNDAARMPWHEGFEQWSRMFGGGQQSETIERVLASARSFTAFAQSMIGAATAGNAGTMPNWADALRNGFQMPGGTASLWARLPFQAVFAAWVAEAMRR